MLGEYDHSMATIPPGQFCALKEVITWQPYCLVSTLCIAISNHMATILPGQ